MPLILGCIADDLTGATDLANTLARRGMSVVQTIGTPSPGTPVPDAEAIVVALKSRTIPAKEAVALSLEACRWSLLGTAPPPFKWIIYSSVFSLGILLLALVAFKRMERKFADVI